MDDFSFWLIFLRLAVMFYDLPTYVPIFVFVPSSALLDPQRETSIQLAT